MFSWIIALLSGIVAAFTPCVIVLIPLFLYRFFHKHERQYKEFAWFLVGFLIFYALFAIFLAQLLTSSVQNGFRLGLGLLFFVLGILSFLDKLNPLNFPLIKNPLLFGASFALIVSFNPCTLGFLGTILTLQQTTMLISNLLFFGIGLLLPSVAFAFLGQSLLQYGRKSAKYTLIVAKLMSALLIGAGIYLALTITSFGRNDLWLALLLLALSLAVFLKSFLSVYKPTELLTLTNILLLIALLLIVFAAAVHCKAAITPTEPLFAIDETASCSEHSITDCKICQICTSIFGIALGIGLIGIFVASKKKK
ncbi:MAG: hypothetical protein H6502_02520 [Candidatus Woesearchaeota archaeon]|nr:MAG: hypothetical protein H6502_02520 [Candidatus Woesearchaeota archaeon]